MHFFSQSGHRVLAAVALVICSAASLLIGGCASAPVAGTLPKPNFSAPVMASTTSQRPQSFSSAPVVTSSPSPAPAASRSWNSPGSASSLQISSSWAPKAAAHDWRWIVIHHSATVEGGAARFNSSHIGKGWDSLGYHFVVGNGTDTPDGRVEAGPRWVQQLTGAHTKSPDNRFNEYGIGVCFVGNFDTDRPTRKQLDESARLVAHLMRTYNIPPERVIGHRDTGRATDCPGNNFQVATLRKLAVDRLRAAGIAVPQETAASAARNAELLRPSAPATPPPAVRKAPTKSPAKSAPSKSAQKSTASKSKSKSKK